MGERYQVIRKLYSSEKSTVELARDSVIKRQVILKRLKVNGTKEKQELSDQIAAIVRINESYDSAQDIYDWFHDSKNGDEVIVLQYISGETLEEKIKKISLCPENSSNQYLFMADCLDCLARTITHVAELHEQQFVHYDIKPENIIIRNNNDVELIDFDLVFSNTRKLLGTPGYQAPEIRSQHNINAIGSPADVYALGIILFRIMMNKLPDERDFRIDPTKQYYMEIPQITFPDKAISDEVNAIFSGMTAFLPKNRTPDESLRNVSNRVFRLSRKIKRFVPEKKR